VSGKVFSYPLFRFDEFEIMCFILIAFGYFFAHRIILKFIKPLTKFIVHKNDKGETVENVPPTKDEVLKFETTCWRFCYFLFNVIAGIVLLKDEKWILDTSLFFEEYPAIVFPTNCRMYYIMQLACYSYVTICLFIDKKQKDFVQMLLHHITTLLLVFFSYEIGFYRIGCVTLILMDFSDPFLELAKTFLYCGYNTIADILFAAFTIVFFFTRNFIYPYYVMHAGIYGAITSNGSYVPYQGYFVVGLVILQGLFLFWGGLIVKIVLYTYVFGWEERGDMRDHDDEEEKTKKKSRNKWKEWTCKEG